MNHLSFAKGALAMFWLVALLNLFYSFAAPLAGWLGQPGVLLKLVVRGAAVAVTPGALPQLLTG